MKSFGVIKKGILISQNNFRVAQGQALEPDSSAKDCLPFIEHSLDSLDFDLISFEPHLAVNLLQQQAGGYSLVTSAPNIQETLNLGIPEGLCDYDLKVRFPREVPFLEKNAQQTHVERPVERKVQVPFTRKTGGSPYCQPVFSVPQREGSDRHHASFQENLRGRILFEGNPRNIQLECLETARSGDVFRPEAFSSQSNSSADRSA